MGTIVINIPQDIHEKYDIKSIVTSEELLERLRQIKPKIGENTNNTLLGLFESESELIDYITETAMQSREKDSLRLNHG